MFNDLIIKAKEVLTDLLQMVFLSSMAVISIGLIASLADLPLPGDG